MGHRGKTSVLTLRVLGVLAVAGWASLGWAESEPVPVTSWVAAVNLAAQYTGLGEASSVTAAYREVTDKACPTFDIAARPVWEVVIDGTRLSVATSDGSIESNPNIRTITVWVDVRTGALLKVFSPKPSEGGLVRKVGDRERELLTANGMTLTPAPLVPGLSFASVLGHTNRAEIGAVLQATEVVAYFGLLTDELHTEDPVKERPFWFVYLGGVRIVLPGGPAGGRGVQPASEALVVLDAESGQWRTTFAVGKVGS